MQLNLYKNNKLVDLNYIVTYATYLIKYKIYLYLFVIHKYSTILESGVATKTMVNKDRLLCLVEILKIVIIMSDVKRTNEGFTP